MVNKKELYGLALLTIANLGIREARDYLGLNKEPFCPETRYEGHLINKNDENIKNKTFYFDDNIEKIDSLYNRPQERHHQLREIYNNRK